MNRIELGQIDVVLYQEGEQWIAQGIQFDITARGANPEEASERFNWKVGAEVIMSLEIGDEKPLSGVPSSPRRFWEMFENAKLKVVEDDVPLRVVDDSPPLRYYGANATSRAAVVFPHSESWRAEMS